MSQDKAKFVHLHTHSHYSLLNALPKISELVDAAGKAQMSALALTDNGNLYGAIEFYKKCKDEDIKPIIGIDAFVAVRTRFDKEAQIDNKRARLVLLAKNETGYKNLLKLVTYSHLEGFYYKPRVDRELLEKYSEGLIVILPSFSAETSLALKNNSPAGETGNAKEILEWYKNTFGSDDTFLEITYHPEIEGHGELQNKIKNLGKDTDTELVAAHDVYYIKPEDRKTRETLMKIQTSIDFAEQGNLNGDEEDFSFISAEKAEEYFKDMPQALENTIKIASKCNLKLELGKWVFPDLKLESRNSYDEELHKLVYAGIKKRALKKTKEVESRIEYELKIIKDKGYSPYFLVVGDLLKFAHENNILTTIRGSVAGSIVTYLANITNVNPIEYKIPFERFLNPERPSPPDIDMDFADNRRDEIIQYAKSKYGEDKVAQIGTFGTMMARGAVRDIARALGYSYNIGDKIAKLIPFGSQGFPMTIERALDITPELKTLYEKEKGAKEIIDMAKKIEGNARHISIHAAGVVIAPIDLTCFVPLQLDPKGGKVITQYDMHSVEDAGLLKFDFLGLKNLAVLADVVKRAKKFHNVDIDIENVPLDDKKTFEMLARGETMGIFQLNGAGMTRYLKDLKPTTIHDINAMVSLYRPGPMESIPSYIERKHNAKLITYLDPRMEDILDHSYGVITYQDDVLLIAIKLGGYSWLEADKLRKAMGKKIPKVMAAEKEKLIQGFIDNGTTKEKAEKLWKLIEPFAAYGFNKAHAASYGKVAYQTAYMKANFPVEYMAAVLTADSGDVDKISESIIELKRMDIPVLPPNINESFGDFTVVENSIRFGLHSIKNFGEGIGDYIINEREHPPAGGGKFKSLADFLERIQDKNLNKKSLEALIKSGAFDEFGERGVQLSNLEHLLEYSKEHSSAPENQDSLFGGMLKESGASKLILEKGEPASQTDKLFWEKELLGLYISGHPLDKHKDKFKNKYKEIKETKETMKNGMTVVISGIVEEVKPILTKRGDQMAFVRIADFSDNVETVFFPEVFAKFKSLVEQEKCVAIKGRISDRNGGISIIAEAVKEL
ncbi:MAG: DNA polymerase III subunit alpha [Candidatus Pacebacteria bacterium]|jgi:DNA polymerase-3 subunit alpha|nr:DNA polymerase III subunit alpha [Parcubacteria group bacterium]MDP6249331.1 DNA polymerase III subunit alpha [Candidatus Paceibacterota bacterium]MDP7159467.1 DNA polymerase III subunit alpha [Candidatus Paceibacterota bacterium]MDP7365969.1 DNA polymerase III subunit alpha [Candidatus Paceibacterota bacterium]MDP7466238.1 DNA polymerase III subunit alpha [Candidatus Paceibacterota bacterium]|tara:strand:- start:21112 stop:24315 length:3204 start_codon:yes stop_codon:yes gene_type:complete